MPGLVSKGLSRIADAGFGVYLAQTTRDAARERDAKLLIPPASGLVGMTIGHKYLDPVIAKTAGLAERAGGSVASKMLGRKIAFTALTKGLGLVGRAVMPGFGLLTFKESGGDLAEYGYEQSKKIQPYLDEQESRKKYGRDVKFGIGVGLDPAATRDWAMGEYTSRTAARRRKNLGVELDLDTVGNGWSDKKSSKEAESGE